MLNALWTGATGMNAQELNINVISNNLANFTKEVRNLKKRGYKFLKFNEIMAKKNIDLTKDDEK